MSDPVLPPHVVGVDLSLTATGLAWPDHHTDSLGATGLTNPRMSLDERVSGLDALAERLYYAITGRRAIFDHWLPRLVVIENLPTGGTAGGVVSTEKGYVWWRVVYLLTGLGIPVLDVSPATGKLYACGMGNANKREVIAGIQEFFPEWEIHKTSKAGKVLTTVDDNKADAVPLMALGCELLGEPLVELPAKHRKALDKLELPPGVRRRIDT